MKKLKYILSAFVIMMAALVPALMLVGCKKHYTVTVTIGEGVGHGNVYKVDALKERVSLLGKNDLEEGSKFDYSVTPFTGYKIKYIKVDGTEIDFDISTDTGDEGYGISRPSLKVKSNHTIEVGFEKREFELTFAYDGQESHVLEHNGQIFKLSGKYETPLNQILLNIADGGFTYDDEECGIVAIDGTEHISANMLLVTSKTEQELKEFLGLVN